MFGILKKFFSDILKDPLFKIGAVATVIVLAVTAVCLACYAVRTEKNQALDAEGSVLFEEALSEDYYDEISSRFVNEDGETYNQYKMTEGLGISVFGDGGVVDETSGGYTMPTLVALNFIERFVYIMGNDGETPESIAAKQGGVPMYADPFMMPSDQTPVKITLKNEYGTTIVPILKNNGGLNPCTIGGIEGTISTDDEGNTYFTRTEEGFPLIIGARAEIVTRAMQNRSGDITVMFLQELPEDYSPYRYAEILEKMRDYHNLEGGGKCFYVISPVLNTDREKAAELDSLLEESFGVYYLNAREYLCGEALEKYDIKIRGYEDEAAVERGQVCSEFLTSKNNLNLYGMYAIADLLTERLNQNDAELLEKRFEYTGE